MGKNRGELIRFLYVLGFFVLALGVLGSYIVWKLFQAQPSPSPLDFSRLEANRVLSPHAPVSPDTARVFFTTDGRYLSAEIMELPRNLTPYQRATQLMDRLARGPTSRYFEPTLPKDARLLGVFITDDEVCLNFSKELGENLRGGPAQELLALYSIVNTIVLNMEGITRVRILINGKRAAILSSEMDISAPLGANLNLIHW